MTSSRVNEIDFLRFFAALAVVFFHYTFRGYAADAMSPVPYPSLAPFSKYGYLGVELFFMISGFVILMTAANGSVQSFITSRLTRLYPAFWACCTITFLVTIILGMPPFSATFSQYLINLTMLSGFIYVPSIDGVYWSLFVEIKFYVLVMAVLLLGRIHQAQVFMALWLATSILLELFPIDRLRSLLIVDSSAFFIAGATYFLIWSQGFTNSRIMLLILSWALAITQSHKNLSVIENHYHTEMNSYVVTGIISTFFLVMLLISTKRTGSFGRKRWILAGALTYPLYLLHQNIGFIIFNLAYPQINSYALLFCTIALMLGLSFLVHIYAEKRYAPPMKNAINQFASYIQNLTNTKEKID